MTLVEEKSAVRDGTYDGRFIGDPAIDLRSRTARGTVVNALFTIASNGITLVQGVVVAALVSTAVYGSWGLLLAAFMTLGMLWSVGIGDKFVQQDESDQQRAFEIAFTLQLLLGALFLVVVLAGMPLFALLYGQRDLMGPGAALALVVPALALQAPLWVHYRRMDFVRQRTLQIVQPITTFVATIALILAGLDVWALVVGATVGTWAASIAMVWSSPYPLRLRFERSALADYKRFTWPLYVSGFAGALLIQAPVLVAAHVLGLTAIAGIALANSIWMFTRRVDEVITQTLYPAICAVKDRTDLLFEAFWKSNRLALLWATPLGMAAALFAGDFVHYVVGEKWRFAAGLIAAYGVTAIIHQIGFNWTAFFRALGDTRPIAVESVVLLCTVSAIAVPLLATDGLTAFGVGMGVAGLATVSVRLWYLKRIFPGMPITRYIAPGILPTVPAVAAILLVREFADGTRSPARVAVEAVLYATLAIVATYAFERQFLRESAGYLRTAG